MFAYQLRQLSALGLDIQADIKNVSSSNYRTIDVYQPSKIARGRAFAMGWYNVNDGRLQTAAHAPATDVSDWLLQAARHCVADV